MPNPTYDGIVREALALPEADKLRLVNTLLGDLEKTDPQLEAVWIRTVRERREARLAGRIVAVPAGDALRALRES